MRFLPSGCAPSADRRVGGVLAALVLLAVLVLLAGCSGSDARCEVTASSATVAEDLRASCERAVPAVEAVWPGWQGQVVIEESAEPLGEGIAARVEGFARDGEPTTGDRLIVDPAATELLSPEGLDVVMRHEITHVAIRASASDPIPMWASEGLAEYVGYRQVPDERRERDDDLAHLREQVASGDWTGTLPSAEAFAGPGDGDDEVRDEVGAGGGEVRDAYISAWLAMQVLIDDLGLEQVVAAMQISHGEVGAGLSDGEREAQFLERFGRSREWLDAQWQAALGSGPG